MIPGRNAEPEFDLSRGRVAVDGNAHVLVSADALLALCRSAGAQAARELGRALGNGIGTRLARRVSLDHCLFIEALDELGAELGWLGLGRLVAERWGQALVLRFDECPLVGPPESVDAVLGGAVEGAIEAWTGRTAHALVIERRRDRIRLLVGGPRAVGMAHALIEAGASHLEVLSRLHESHDAVSTAAEPK